MISWRGQVPFFVVTCRQESTCVSEFQMACISELQIITSFITLLMSLTNNVVSNLFVTYVNEHYNDNSKLNSTSNIRYFSFEIINNPFIFFLTQNLLHNFSLCSKLHCIYLRRYRQYTRIKYKFLS